jgi:hypothetical protein
MSAAINVTQKLMSASIDAAIIRLRSRVKETFAFAAKP